MDVRIEQRPSSVSKKIKILARASIGIWTLFCVAMTTIVDSPVTWLTSAILISAIAFNIESFVYIGKNIHL